MPAAIKETKKNKIMIPIGFQFHKMNSEKSEISLLENQTAKLE